MNNVLNEIEWVDPAIAFGQFYDQEWSLFFDSSDLNHSLSRVSYILIEPSEIIKNTDQNPFPILAAKHNSLSDTSPYFTGGWAGYFGYDLAFLLEVIKRNADKKQATTPNIALGYYTKGYVFDHKTHKAFNIGNAPRLTPPSLLQKKHKADFKATLSAEDYKYGIQKIIDYICAGDIFQANLTQRFEAKREQDFNPWLQYLSLRETSPAPFSAYMNLGDIQLLSSSPELFLSIQNEEVETRPIKGTLPKDQDPDILIASEKDRAENIMIVDLLRNDLAKTCEDHSIHEPKLCNLETFSHVHHLVSTVSGTMKKDHTPFEVIEGCFPGGSITGAPKIRAMQIIEELEPYDRGAYCGSFGFIGDNGNTCTNIAIRTLICDKDQIWFNVGGGITAVSDPAQEYQETLDKAQGILRSFTGDACF